MTVIVGPIRVADGETSKRRIEHAVAVPWGGLQATKRPRALAMVAPLANLVLRSPNGTNRLRALPWAPSILGIVAAVILDRLVLGVPVRRYPQRAVIDDFLRIRRMEVFARSANPVARNPVEIAARTREAIFPRLLKCKKVLPLFWRDSCCIPRSRHWRGCGLWWRRNPCVLAHRSQVMPSSANVNVIPNHRIGIFLQGTKPWHALSAPCPSTECCHPQRRDCLAAFILRRDLKCCGTRRQTVVELLILRVGRCRCRRRGRKCRGLRRRRCRHGYRRGRGRRCWRR
mmetsp:Transcript_15471/g.49675  ORF Transcript_15471/g.49675 Transcript_15471/m.49675 type:complete len:286 (-) Transcript_15471:634-1491(-)